MPGYWLTGFGRVGSQKKMLPWMNGQKTWRLLPGLRKWFDHSSELWPEFRKKYTAELKANEEVAEFVKKYHDKKKITLLYAAKSEDYNNAVVLKQYLEKLW